MVLQVHELDFKLSFVILILDQKITSIYLSFALFEVKNSTSTCVWENKLYSEFIVINSCTRNVLCVLVIKC